jgi:hypothetical protein
MQVAAVCSMRTLARSTKTIGLCERHGGKNNIGRANAKDEEYQTAFQAQSAECALLASVQSSEKPQHSPATFRRSSTLDPKPKPKAKKVAPKVQAKSQSSFDGKPRWPNSD